MGIPTATTTSTSSSTSQTSTTTNKPNQLGKDDFLKILTIQLSNQDPANPLQDKDFIAQMAQFSTLEQMTNMNKTLEDFASKSDANTQQMALSQFSSTIGKEITWKDSTTQATSTGVVSGVSSQDGSYYYLIGNQKVPTDQVNQIKEVAAATQNSSTTTNSDTTGTSTTSTSTTGSSTGTATTDTSTTGSSTANSSITGTGTTDSSSTNTNTTNSNSTGSGTTSTSTTSN